MGEIKSKNMCKVNCCSGSVCMSAKVGKYLLIVGGLNWGLVGVVMLMDNGSNWNVINLLLGGWPMVEGIVYVLMGVAAIMKIFGCKCSKCAGGVCTPGGDMQGKM